MRLATSFLISLQILPNVHPNAQHFWRPSFFRWDSINNYFFAVDIVSPRSSPHSPNSFRVCLLPLRSIHPANKGSCSIHIQLRQDVSNCLVIWLPRFPLPRIIHSLKPDIWLVVPTPHPHSLHFPCTPALSPYCEAQSSLSLWQAHIRLVARRNPCTVAAEREDHTSRAHPSTVVSSFRGQRPAISAN